MAQAPTTNNSEKDEKSENEDGLEHAIGRRVRLDNNLGTIRYVGPVATSKKESTIWLGIEWDDENRGKHDGSVCKDGIIYHYFKCLDKQGSFIKPIKLLNNDNNNDMKMNGFGNNLLIEILQNYSLDNLECDLLTQDEISKESKFKIEFVGWKKSMKQQCDLNTKTDIILDRSNVSCIINSENNINKLEKNDQFIDEMKKLREKIPCAQCLDLRRNLLSSVNNLYGIHCLNDTLVDLDLSHNKLNMFYCFSNNNNNDGLTKSFDIFNKIFKIPNTFKNLKRLILNDTSSIEQSIENIETKYYFNTWEFVYYLILNECIPNICEIEMCDNNLNTMKLYVPQNGNFNDNNKENWCNMLPNASIICQNVPKLKVINIGSNHLSDWNEISYLFGKLPNLKKLQASWCDFESITYNDSEAKMNDKNSIEEEKGNDNGNDECESGKEFGALTTLFVRNNQFTDISLFDELNKFPKLNNLLFLESKFSNVFGNQRLRDFAIAKMKNLFICNSSLILENERHDSELYYLKYITSQVNQLKLEDDGNDKSTKKQACQESGVTETSEDTSNEQKENSNNDNENEDNNNDSSKEDEMNNKIEKLFPRYKELVAKYGLMKEKKIEEETFQTVNVRLLSMDPKSITVESLFKKLPVHMTVGQLKMLFKRYYKLHPKHQRLMMREKGSQQMPIDLGNDISTLQFCGVKDGMEILMQSNDFNREN